MNRENYLKIVKYCEKRKCKVRTNYYDIFLDIKDTRSADKTKKLHEVLSNTMYDFNKNIIKRKLHTYLTDFSTLIRMFPKFNRLRI